MRTVTISTTDNAELTRAVMLRERMNMRHSPEDRRVRAKYAALEGLQRMSGVKKFAFLHRYTHGRG